MLLNYYWLHMATSVLVASRDCCPIIRIVINIISWYDNSILCHQWLLVKSSKNPSHLDASNKGPPTGPTGSHRPSGAFLRWGIPQIIIHFRWGFSLIDHLFLWIPFMETPIDSWWMLAVNPQYQYNPIESHESSPTMSCFILPSFLWASPRPDCDGLLEVLAHGFIQGIPISRVLEFGK